MIDAPTNLVAVRLRLRTQQTVILPHSLGRAVYWFFMQLLETYAPELSAELREPNRLRPFTVSDLLCSSARFGSGGYIISAGNECYVRFTGLSAHVVAVLDAFTADLPESVLIGDTIFDVIGIDTAPDVAARTRRTTYQDILESNFYSSSAMPLMFKFRFLSPTGFKTDRQELPLPVPELVFGSLLSRWNAFAAGPLPDDSRLFAGTHIRLGRCRIETHPITIDNYTHIGFTGYAEFKSASKERFYLHTLHTLAAFSFFSGVGYETAAGMGQIELV